MTIWLCDMCGKQVNRDSNFAGKYDIQTTFFEFDSVGCARKVQRKMKFCDECAMKMEKILDDAFTGIPEEITVDIDRRR